MCHRNKLSDFNLKKTRPTASFLNTLYFNLFLILSLFQWVSFQLNSFDTQPWLSIYVLLFWLCYAGCKNRLPTYFIQIFIFISFLIFTTALTILVGEDYGFTLKGLSRDVVNYLTFFLVFATYIYFHLKHGFNERMFFAVNTIWLAVGLLQVIFGSELFDFLVTVRTSETRGVTGLAPEPTYYAFFLIFLNLIYLVVNDYKLNGKTKYYFVLNLIFIVFVAKSSMLIVVILLAAILFTIYRINSLVHVIKFLLMFVVIIAMGSYFLAESRPGQIVLNLLSNGGVAVLESDASIRSRLLSVIYPYVLTFQNFLVPGGFFSFSENASDANIHFFGLDLSYVREKDVIMSYFGSVIYQMGFMGFLIMIYFLSLIYDGSRRSLFEIFFMAIILQLALTVAFSLAAILFGLYYIRKRDLRCLKY